MNNELIGRIDRMLCCYPTKTINKVLQDCKAALTQQQQEAEPFGWFTEDYADDKSATTYSAEVAERWRAKGWPVTPLFTKSAAQPQVPDGWRESLQELVEAMYDYGMGVDCEAPAAHRMMMRKAEALLSAAKEEGK